MDEDWYPGREATELDVRAIGKRIAGAGQKAVQKGIDVAKRQAMAIKLKGSFSLMAKEEQMQLSSLRRVMSSISPGSTLAMNVQDLIRMKEREVSLIQNLNRMV